MDICERALEAADLVSWLFECRKGSIWKGVMGSQGGGIERLTRATTAKSSGQADVSPMAVCWRLDLKSSSAGTSLTRVRAASWASCFAAVFLTEGDEPVSRRRRRRSKLGG